jgi:cold shock CspA family protein
MSVVIGQVKWFNMKAGYGFINVRTGEHTGKDLFVHYTSIKVVNSQYRYLIAGEYVQFNVDVPSDGKHEFHAVNVTGIENGPVMCEARREAATATPDKPQRRSSDNDNNDQQQQGSYTKVVRKIRTVRKPSSVTTARATKV